MRLKSIIVQLLCVFIVSNQQNSKINLKDNNFSSLKTIFEDGPENLKATGKVISNNRPDGEISIKNSTSYNGDNDYLTPEMFGAKGDGVSDDYKAIQMMLDKGSEGCTFYFDGKKTYYNAFANSGKWIEPMKRNIWQRHKSAKFLFNGAKLTRRTPRWSMRNVKNDYNKGKYYTDDHSALLYLTGENYYIDGANFNSNVKKGNLLDWDEKKTGNYDYAVGTCMEMGLWLDRCKNITITNSSFSHSVFPVYVTTSKNLNLKNIKLSYAAQANKRIHSKDQALGGGIKLQDCSHVVMTGIVGFRNLNDTIELESYNNDIKVQGSSTYDYSNSLVVSYSQDIELDWEATHVISGSGVLIRGGESKKQTKNIKGRITVSDTSWAGVLFWLIHDAKNSIDNIDLDIKTANTGYTGLFLNNESENEAIKGLRLKHDSKNDGTATGIARIFNNKVSGVCTGSTSNALVGVKTNGRNADSSMSVKFTFGPGFQTKYETGKSAKLITP
jgi:hypothetical protein